MSYLNFILLIFIVIVLGILYHRYQEKKYRVKNQYDNYDSIKKYLLSESSLANNKKPIIWVHIPYEYNSRAWQSYGSRSSHDLNQPYLYLTAKSLIKHCDDSFKICLIDDSTFEKLIPNWKVDMTLLSNPISGYVRQMAIAKLIHVYGGMCVPLSFLCFRNLDEMYEKGTRNDKMFVCENVNRNITSTTNNFSPDCRFFGAKKDNEMVGLFIDFMQRMISTDYTSEGQFQGDFDRWCQAKVRNNKVRIIDGSEVGVKTSSDKPIIVDDLMGRNYVDIYKNAYGIWIPSADILRRTQFEWFAKISPKEVMESNTILGKYILLANAPEEGGGAGLDKLTNDEPKPHWTAFWKPPDFPITENVI